MSIHVYIINHTHWDREWFLTSEYTSRWIPSLIENLEGRAASNPSFRYWLDGQTLVVEDLLRIAPEMDARVRQLIESGRLAIGPYYSQPDWQLASGELLVRNLQYGIQDTTSFGGAVESGWLVDTFGHISQTPQIHRMFGLRALFVWRGVPQLVPYFAWQGADGASILTINLFGGYRNLYGVTHVPEVAVRRLTAEVERLGPYYPTPDIPLFDGYDLEDDPEDPLSFYLHAHELDSKFELHEATPSSFSSLISKKALALPALHGELNSGKYGATFPGAFSARTYLKLMAHDCQDLLFRRCEPLAALATLYGQSYPREQFERIGRLLLQNGVHDCICGVSIDQVHEKMARSYRRVFEELLEILQRSLALLMQDFTPGEYAVSTNPFAGEHWLIEGSNLMRSQTNGIGIWPVSEKISIEASEPEQETSSDFVWRNDHYDVRLQPDGRLRIGDALLGELQVYRELGDTYSDERGDLLGVMQPANPPRLIQASARHAVMEYESSWHGHGAWVSARVRLLFDPSPLVRWEIDLDSSGADLDVEMSFATKRRGEIWAGMPLDLVQRPEVDADLLPRQPPAELTRILLGQRELGEVRTFPFHNLVAISDDRGSAVVFARGLHAYRAEAGTLSLTLRRSVEWLTRADLEHRIGDAGPFFYVPDARCEREEHHELAFAVLPYPANSMKVQSLNAFFQNPPLVVHSAGPGTRRQEEFLQEDLPLSSLQMQEDALLARFYNPTEETVLLSGAYPEADVWGKVQADRDSVAPKKIVTLRLDLPLQQIGSVDQPAAPSIRVLNLPAWRVGPNHGAPDLNVLTKLEEKIGLLDDQLEQIARQLTLTQATGEPDWRLRLRLEHRQAALERERLEYRLSLLLNRRKLEYGGDSPPEALEQVDPEIAALGKELNRLRIKRRIYDYVVQVLD